MNPSQLTAPRTLLEHEAKVPQEPELYFWYASHRAADGSMFWDDDVKGWAVLDFETCKYIEEHEELFAHPDRRDIVGDDELYEMIKVSHGGERALILLQGPPHRALHGSMARDISARTRSIRPHIRELVERYVSRLDGRVEFIHDLANLLPTAVISAVFELPWVDDEATLRTARKATAEIGDARQSLDRTSKAWQIGGQAAAVLSEQLLPFVLERETADGEDLISRFWRTGHEIFDDWSAADVLAQCRTVFFAGSNSSTHFLSVIIYVLATNPQVWPYLREDPKRAKVFIEEILRVIPPVQGRPRIPTEDVTVHGIEVKAGQVIYLYNGAANRDPAQFERPDVMDLSLKPRLHMTFNSGPRTCAGSSTARTEGEEFVLAVLRHFDSVTLDTDAPLPVYAGGLNRGFAPLHLIMKRRTAVEEREAS